MKLGCYLLGFLLALVAGSSAIAKPPKIIVSKETTYLTEPLDEQGQVDYRRAMLERMRKKKVPSEENGAVLFWETVGLDSIEKEHREAFCQELGIELSNPSEMLQMVDSPEVIQSLTAWVLEQQGHEASEAARRALDPEIKAAYLAQDLIARWDATITWAMEPPAPLLEWDQRNSKQLDRIVEATLRPTWYELPPGFCSAPTGKVDEWLRPLGPYRSAAVSLAVRARIRIEQGDYAAAQADIVAIHRLTRLYPSDLLIDRLIAMVLRRAAIKVELAFFERTEVPIPALRNSLREFVLNYLPESKSREERMLWGERLFNLHYLQLLANSNNESVSMFTLLMDAPAKERFQRLLQDDGEPLDWNLLLRLSNDAYDFAEKSAKELDLQEFDKAMDNYQNRFVKTLPHPLGKTAKLSPQQRARLLYYELYKQSGNPVSAYVQMKTRQETLDRLQIVAMALAIQRNEEGEYPDSLDDLPFNRIALKSEKLQRALRDTFTDSPLAYRKTKEGYLLYSFGPNGKDDGGSHSDWKILRGYTDKDGWERMRQLLGEETPEMKNTIPEGADDLAIRLPLLKVNLSGIAKP